MTIGEMLGQSGLLTLLGMGVVFAFLIIMIICMNLLHAVLHALKMDQDEKKEAPQASAPVQDKGAIVAAIAAAVHEKEA